MQSHFAQFDPVSRHRVLAEMVGTTRPRINMFMNRFRKKGFIDYDGGLEVRQSLRKALRCRWELPVIPGTLRTCWIRVGDAVLGLSNIEQATVSMLESRVSWRPQQLDVYPIRPAAPPKKRIQKSLLSM
jgi:hypothetical protein